MKRQKDGWIDGQIDRVTDDRLTVGQMDRWTDDRWTDEQMDRQTDRQTDGLTGRWTVGKMDSVID